MANLNDYFGCFRLNLKIPVFQWYKRFFKAALCPGWNVQSRSQRLLFVKKVANIDIFSRILVMSWNTIHDTADIFVYTKVHAKRR